MAGCGWRPAPTGPRPAPGERAVGWTSWTVSYNT